MTILPNRSARAFSWPGLRLRSAASNAASGGRGRPPRPPRVPGTTTFSPTSGDGGGNGGAPMYIVCTPEQMGLLSEQDGELIQRKARKKMREDAATAKALLAEYTRQVDELR